MREDGTPLLPQMVTAVSSSVTNCWMWKDSWHECWHSERLRNSLACSTVLSPTFLFIYIFICHSGGGEQLWVILGADDSFFQSKQSVHWGFLKAQPNLCCPEAQQRVCAWVSLPMISSPLLVFLSFSLFPPLPVASPCPHNPLWAFQFQTESACSIYANISLQHPIYFCSLGRAHYYLLSMWDAASSWLGQPVPVCLSLC